MLTDMPTPERLKVLTIPSYIKRCGHFCANLRWTCCDCAYGRPLPTYCALCARQPRT